MNVRAKEIGLAHTTFKNSTGLDISPSEAGAYGTARDVALLMEYIIVHYPQVTRLTTIDATRVYNEDGAYHDVENTNDVVDDIEGLIASKTGYTELAGGNLVVAFDAGLNRPIVAVVLGSTQKERFTDILTLTESARDYIVAQPQ
jgi:D-alanyl-D-alanine carboxypeptidase (penicillin-binding protein 5/6)